MAGIRQVLTVVLIALGLSLPAAAQLPPCNSDATLNVTLSGQYTSGVGQARPFVGSPFSIAFQVRQCPVDLTTETSAFVLHVDGTYTNGGVVRQISGTAGWFALGGDYQGIDVRFYDMYTAGDNLQVIFQTPAVPFTGALSTPRITVVTYTGHPATAYYFPSSSTDSIAAAIGGAVYAVTTARTTCNPELAASRLDLPATASTQSVGFTLPTGCTWNAASSAPWLTLAQSSGTGNGLLSLTATANTGGSPRSATVTVNGQELSVLQAGQECTYTVAPSFRSAPAAGGANVVFVTAPTGCAWNAVSDSPWITISGAASGTGNGSVTYTAARNVIATPRTGSLRVARRSVLVRQNGTAGAVECTLLGGVPPVVRAEGLSELTGETLMQCTSSATGTTMADILVTYNVPLSGRIAPDSTLTDAWILVDEASGSGVVPGKTGFRGRLAGPATLRFTGVPVAAVGAVRSLRLVNARVNPTDLPPGTVAPATVLARFEVRSPVPVSFDVHGSDPRAVVAFVQTGLKSSPAASSAVGTNATLFPLRFEEQFATAFRRRIDPGQSPSKPGATYNSESGFLSQAMGNDGLADTGTRLRARVAVPAGVRVYAAIRPTEGMQAQLVSANSAGVGGTPLTGTARFGGTYQQLVPVGGFATAVWEVQTPDPLAMERYTMNLVMENATATQLDQVRQSLSMSYAPVSTVVGMDSIAPIPRFLDPGIRARPLNIRVSGRSILLPGRSADSGGKNGVPLAVGSNYTFNYDVFNESAEGSSTVTVTGNLPPQFSYTGCTVPGGTCSSSGSEVTATVPTVPPGGSVSVTVQATQTAPADGVLDSNVYAGGSEPDPNIGNNEATLALTLEECTVGSLSPTSAAFTQAGGDGSFNIGGGCLNWTLTNNATWVLINSPTSGSGAATIQFTVQPNLTGVARSTTIIAGGLAFTINQAATGCNYVLTTAGQTTSPAEGRLGTIPITVSGVNCAWTAVSNTPWLEVAIPTSGTVSGNIGFTVYPNFGTQQRVGSLTIAGQIVNITQSGMTGSVDLRFVRRTYFNALRRLPGAAEETFHLGRLTSGVTRSQMMADFLETTEFRAGGAFVTGLYRVLLGRLPEKSGWDFQLNSIVRNGSAQSAVAANFLTTPEWVLKQGGAVSDAAFVNLLFQEILGRAPTDAERNFQVSQIAGNLAARAQLTTNFLGIQEFFLRRGNLLNALHTYFVILGRDATPVELAGVEAQLAAGTPFRTIVNTFVTSAEHNQALQ